jgi:hypothetical protein
MKKLAVVGLTTLQILTAMSAVLPGIKQIWGTSPNPVDVLAVNFALLSISVPIALGIELKPTREAIEQIRDSETQVSWLKALDFYPQFTSELKKARDFVDIAYLAAYPPQETIEEVRRRYYQELPALMKKRSDVSFRRLVRHSQKNEPWIKQILKDMAGARNFALCVVEDDESKEHSLALSVQVIDNDKAWLVAVNSHEPRGGPRDIALLGNTVSDGLRHYYNRLWERGKVLMTAGNLTDAGKAYVEGHA